MRELATWYVPEGETHHLTFPEPATVCNDRGDLYAVVVVEEADTDDPVLLKQYGAGDTVVARLEAYSDIRDEDVSNLLWELSRDETGRYDFEESVRDASDVM